MVFRNFAIALSMLNRSAEASVIREEADAIVGTLNSEIARSGEEGAGVKPPNP
jgi:hypothetical protein